MTQTCESRQTTERNIDGHCAALAGMVKTIASVRACQTKRMARLRDVVAPQCRLLLVGINPSLRSAEVGHHFASPGNPFWRLLYASGLVGEALTCERDAELVRYGISLTNLCPRPTRAAAELTKEEMKAGARTLRRKCARWRPQVVGFVGISLYQFVFDLPKSGGPGAKPERLGGACVYVIPNPSGLNASFPGFADKLVWFQRLRAMLDQVAPRTGITDRGSC